MLCNFFTVYVYQYVDIEDQMTYVVKQIRFFIFLMKPEILPYTLTNYISIII